MSIKKLAKGLKNKDQRSQEVGKDQTEKPIHHEKKGKGLIARSVSKPMRQKGSGRGR